MKTPWSFEMLGTTHPMTASQSKRWESYSDAGVASGKIQSQHMLEWRENHVKPWT
jgi:hypothetical protein